MANELDLVLVNTISQAVKAEADIFEKYTRLLATPKIKGELTRGKLRWRGISIHQTPEGRQVFQRGNAISPIVSIA